VQVQVQVQVQRAKVEREQRQGRGKPLIMVKRSSFLTRAGEALYGEYGQVA
jgi:hypothetical protein